MVTMSPELVVIVMFGGLVACLVLGYPLGIAVGGVAMVVGYITMGEKVFYMAHLRVLGLMNNYVLVAAPLFIFMGIIMESGSASQLYKGLYILFGGFRGGLAIATILMGTLLAACVGIIAASVIMIGLIAVPNMLSRGYNKELICGTVCASGTLGILIPPSLMLIIYGPMSGLSVGKLFMGAFFPGLLLSALYICYVAITCWLRPELAPPVPEEERMISPLKKLYLLISSVLPLLLIIFAVLGTIFLGIATPTESAAIGVVAATLLGVGYRQLNFRIFKDAVFSTFSAIGMGLIIGVGATIFTGVFLQLEGGDVVKELIMLTPGGIWGAFILIMFIIFILGMFVDWLGIIFILIPIVTPLGDGLGFDPIWFAMMICINLQTSFLTPPFAYAIFFLQGISKPEWGITTPHIMRGVIPFVILILIGIALCIAFPQIILWLPSVSIK